MKENDKKRRGSVSSREELLNRSGRKNSGELRRTSSRQSSYAKSIDEHRRKSGDERKTSTEKRHADPERRKKSTEPQRKKTTQRSGSNGTGRKKKKKKSWIRRYYRLLIVLFVFVLILGFLLNGLINLFSGSKGTVRRAYAKTISLYNKRDSVAKTILGKDVQKLIDKGNISQSFELALTDNTAGAKEISISGELNKNTSSKTADAQLTAAYKDASIAQFKMYTDNKQIMFSAPGLYDGWLSMNCENILSQLSDSALASNIEYSEEQDFSLKMFDDEQSQGEVVMSLSDELSQIFTKEINALSKKADYKKLKEKKAVAIDGTDKNCRGYQITIKDEDLKNFLINMLSSIRRNKKIKSYITRYAEIEYYNVSALHMLFEDSDRLVDNYYKQMDDALEKLNRASFKDTGATVYIYKGVIADFDFNTVYSIDEDQVNINLRGGMFGGKRPSEDFSLTLALNDGKNDLNVSYAETTDNIDSMLTHTAAFLIGNGTDDLLVSTKVNFDKSTGVINGSANLTTPSGGYVDISGSGNLKKANGITKVDAKEIRLDYNGKLNLTMSGSYEIKQFNSKVDKPSGDVIELFKADDAQLDQIESTIGSNIDTAINSLNDALDNINLTINDPNAETESSSETTTEEASSETTTEETKEENEDTENSEDTPTD